MAAVFQFSQYELCQFTSTTRNIRFHSLLCMSVPQIYVVKEAVPLMPQISEKISRSTCSEPAIKI